MSMFVFTSQFSLAGEPAEKVELVAMASTCKSAEESSVETYLSQGFASEEIPVADLKKFPTYVGAEEEMELISLKENEDATTLKKQMLVRAAAVNGGKRIIVEAQYTPVSVSRVVRLNFDLEKLEKGEALFARMGGCHQASSAPSADPQEVSIMVVGK
ncbi:MAG: hypothetical protein AAF203_02335 [Pseudomonadota bacterium]